MAKISVVIPTYNRSDLIGDTLRAVLAQTVPPDEVIVVDDGSTDGTADVVASFGGPVRCVVIPNSGDMVARNVGVRAAQGKLVAFCDSDDLWSPAFLAETSACWRAEPRLTACYSNFRILQDGVLSSRSKFEDAPASFLADLRSIGRDAGVFDRPFVEKLLTFQPLFPSCMMVSRASFLEMGGWDEAVGRIVGCDFATTLRVASHPPVGFVQRPLVGIRKHGSNFSGNTEQMNLGDARVLEHVLRTRPDLARLGGAIQASVARRRTEALDGAFSRRDFAAVQDIYALLPSSARGMKQRAKRAIAILPPPLGKFTASLVSR